MDGVSLLFWAIILLGLYFLPTIIAAGGNHKRAGPILVINFFLGWTLLGWVISLAWALDFSSHRKKEEARHPENSLPHGQFGHLQPLYEQLREFLCGLGGDVREFTESESRITFEVDFGGTSDTHRGNAKNGFVQVRSRQGHLLLWVRLKPESAEKPSGLRWKNRRGPDGGRFPLEVRIGNAAELNKAKALLLQAYERKITEGHNNQPKI